MPYQVIFGWKKVSAINMDRVGMKNYDAGNHLQ